MHNSSEFTILWVSDLLCSNVNDFKAILSIQSFFKSDWISSDFGKQNYWSRKFKFDMNNNDIIILSLHNRNLLLPQQHSWLVAPNVVAEQLLAATGLIPSDFSFFFLFFFFSDLFRCLFFCSVYFFHRCCSVVSAVISMYTLLFSIHALKQTLGFTHQK